MIFFIKLSLPHILIQFWFSLARKLRMRQNSFFQPFCRVFRPKTDDFSRTVRQKTCRRKPKLDQYNFQMRLPCIFPEPLPCLPRKKHSVQAESSIVCEYGDLEFIFFKALHTVSAETESVEWVCTNWLKFNCLILCFQKIPIFVYT